MPTQLLEQFLGALNDGLDDLARDQMLVAANGARKQNRSSRPHAQQVIQIHDQRVLRNALPDGQIARFFPVHVSQGRLRTCPIGVHDDAMFVAAGQVVRNNFTESLGEQALIHPLYRSMHLLLASGDTSACVSRFLHEKWCLVARLVIKTQDAEHRSAVGLVSPFLFIFGAHLGNVRIGDEQTLLAVSHCNQAIACDAAAD